MVFVAYFFTRVVYAIIFQFLLRIIWENDPEIGSGTLAFIVAVFMPSFLAGIGAMVVTEQIFRRSDLKVVFYVFCSVTLTIILAGTAVTSSTPSDGDNPIVVLVEFIFIVVGARIGYWCAKANRQKRLRRNQILTQ